MSTNDNKYTTMSGRKRSIDAVAVSNVGRSVVDYSSKKQLRDALLKPPPSFRLNDAAAGDEEFCNILRLIAQGEPVQAATNSHQTAGGAVTEALDWVLPSFDPETTEPQDLTEELNRLQVLKSYLVLDVEREQAFDRITSLASRMFDVPIAIVSLVDLGRQYLLSTTPFAGDLRETTRKHGFCAHAILNKQNCMVLPDTTLDFRFRNFPLVAGPPYIRFYAGHALLAPEGYKLGTFCILDIKPHPGGLNQEERDSLAELAEMTVQVMVDRREKLLRKKKQDESSNKMAYTASDLMIPLEGVQLCLTLLKDDAIVKSKLSKDHLELLDTAANCTDMMERICKSMAGEEASISIETGNLLSAVESEAPVYGTFVAELAMTDLVANLNQIMGTVPKKVPLQIRLDPDVPPVVLVDDLKLSRSALNLMKSAVERTSSGMILLRIRQQEENTLVFECEDCGPDIPQETVPSLFQPSSSDDGDLRVRLSSVAALVDSMGGRYGYRPYGASDNDKSQNRALLTRPIGSVFWFSVPLVVPE